jgi:hypothetical protein
LEERWRVVHAVFVFAGLGFVGTVQLGQGYGSEKGFAACRTRTLGDVGYCKFVSERRDCHHDHVFLRAVKRGHAMMRWNTGIGN